MAESSAEILSINCPKCGAPYGGEGGCGYCGSEIVITPTGATARSMEVKESNTSPTPIEAHQSWVGKKLQGVDEFLGEIFISQEGKPELSKVGTFVLGGAWSLIGSLYAARGDWPRWAQEAGRVLEHVRAGGMNANQIIGTGREILKFTYEHPQESLAVGAGILAVNFYTAFALRAANERTLSEE